MKLVSLTDAKSRLRIDGTGSDSDLDLMLAGASKAVVRYLGDAADDFLDSFGEPAEDSSGDPIDVPEDVQNAVLMLVGIWFRDPSGVDAEKWSQGYLPAPVTCLLYPLRTPTIA